MMDGAAPVKAAMNTDEPTQADGPPRHVYLVDGSGFIFRAFHALPPHDPQRRHACQRGLWLLQHADEAA